MIISSFSNNKITCFSSILKQLNTRYPLVLHFQFNMLHVLIKTYFQFWHTFSTNMQELVTLCPWTDFPELSSSCFSIKRHGPCLFTVLNIRIQHIGLTFLQNQCLIFSKTKRDCASTNVLQLSHISIKPLRGHLEQMHSGLRILSIIPDTFIVKYCKPLPIDAEIILSLLRHHSLKFSLWVFVYCRFN